MERFLILLIYLLLGAVTGIHKILGDFPPVWFKEKFDGSLIGMIPGGTALSFGIITILELSIAVLFIIAILKKEYKKDIIKTYSRAGFLASLLLFLILFFGSFLIQNYDNGFFDFVYFACTIFLMKFFLSEERI